MRDQDTIPFVTRRSVLASGLSSMMLARGVTAAQVDGSLVARGFVRDGSSSASTASMIGIAGVLVSNGADVVETGADGSFALPIASGESVFVIKPANWSTARSRGALPGGTYLHQPAGTPAAAALRYSGVAPTGTLPASIEFELYPEPESVDFDVLLLADTQPSSERELGYVRDDCIVRAAGIGARFAIHHGDVMADNLGLFDRYMAMIALTGMTWHHCPGNHDMNLDCPAPAFAFETWKRVFGRTHYAFQSGDATFFVLNNVERCAGGRGYRGAFGDRQLRFVENVLKFVPADKLVVLSMHIPLTSFDAPGSASDSTADAPDLLRLLAGRPNVVSFAGHSHTTEHHYLAAPGARPHHHQVLTAVSGSWWGGPLDQRGIPTSVNRDGSPKGLHILEVRGSSYETRFVPSDGAPQGGLRASIECPDRLAAAPGASIVATDLGLSSLVVDVFDGGPRTSVSFTVQGYRANFVMSPVPRTDPFVVADFALAPETRRPWVAPAVSSHMWTAPLPADLPPGQHMVAVTALGEFGKRLSCNVIFEVSASA